MADTLVGVDLLVGKNYPTWKVQMQMVLMKMGVWRIVDGTEVAPNDDVGLRKFNERKDKALATIVLGVKTNLLYLLGEPKDPGQVWTLLANQFQKKSWANKLTLRRKLNGLKLHRCYTDVRSRILNPVEQKIDVKITKTSPTVFTISFH